MCFDGAIDSVLIYSLDAFRLVKRFISNDTIYEHTLTSIFLTFFCDSERYGSTTSNPSCSFQHLKKDRLKHKQTMKNSCSLISVSRNDYLFISSSSPDSPFGWEKRRNGKNKPTARWHYRGHKVRSSILNNCASLREIEFPDRPLPGPRYLLYDTK